jgi:hypothetical protein
VYDIRVLGGRRPDRIVVTLSWSVHTARMTKETGPSAGELILFIGQPRRQAKA